MEGTAESTPAASVDTSAPAVSERPTSAHDALTQAAAAITSETAAPLETAATGPAQPGDPASALHPSTGSPPEKHWPTILENARTKAKDEALAQWRQQHGWAEQVDRQAVERMGQIAELYQRDRPGYIRQILADAVSDPTLAPVVRSEAARILGQRQAPPVDLSPDIPVIDEQGRVVSQTLSAERIQARIDAGIAKALGTMGEQVKPLLSEREARQQREQAAEEDRQLEAYTGDLYNEACDVLPHFKEYEPEIARVMATIPGDPARAMRQAWKQVVGPTLSAKAKAEVLDSFSKKAAAQTVDGSGKAASTPTRPRTVQELAAFMRQANG